MRANRPNRRIPPLLLCITLLGFIPQSGCESPARSYEGTIPTWQRSEVYFGLTRRDGSTISDDEWKRFLNERIVPEFPSGLTVLSADGRWRDSWGVVHAEPSRVLVVMYRASETLFDTKLRQVARQYAEEFGQESVMRADVRTRVEFIYAPTTAPATAPASPSRSTTDQPAPTTGESR